jgi:hypothetical protein
LVCKDHQLGILGKGEKGKTYTRADPVITPRAVSVLLILLDNAMISKTNTFQIVFLIALKIKKFRGVDLRHVNIIISVIVRRTQTTEREIHIGATLQMCK